MRALGRGAWPHRSRHDLRGPCGLRWRGAGPWAGGLDAPGGALVHVRARRWPAKAVPPRLLSRPPGWPRSDRAQPRPSREPVTGEARGFCWCLARLCSLPLYGRGRQLPGDGALGSSPCTCGGIDHLFVPNVLTEVSSPLAAGLSLGWTPPEPSPAPLLFYLAFVAGSTGWRSAEDEPRWAASRPPLPPSPAFVTLQPGNDGNYVEVWPSGPGPSGWRCAERGSGITCWPWRRLLLGLAFWCHILAIIHLAAFGLACSSPCATPRSTRRRRLGAQYCRPIVEMRRTVGSRWSRAAQGRRWGPG
jgi:hypothetical protein